MSALRVRAFVRDRDDRCVDCNLSREEYFAQFGRALDVHRLTPGSPYTVDGCVALCRKCHRRRHRSTRPKRGPVKMVPIPADIFHDVRIVAPIVANEKPFPYIWRILREAIATDLPEAARILEKEVAAMNREPSPHPKGKQP